MTSKYKQQRKKEIPMNNEAQLTPEQAAMIKAEKEMMTFIETNGIEAMVHQQRDWKLNDMKAKLAAQSNIKAWFETTYELADLNNKHLLESLVMLKEDGMEATATAFNSFKIGLYNQIISVYENIDIDVFEKEEFVNPFIDIWESYEGKRINIADSLRELYAWSILEDPVIWASSMHTMVAGYKASQFTEED